MNSIPKDIGTSIHLIISVLIHEVGTLTIPPWYKCTRYLQINQAYFEEVAKV